MSQPMKKMLIIVILVFGLLFAWYGAKKAMFMGFMMFYKPPAVTVAATTATSKVWQSFVSSVGTLTAVNGVDISAEASGIIKEIRFTSGQFVKKGDILFLLDTSIEEAQLKDNQARLKLAQLNYDRNKALLGKHAISQASLDNILMELQQAEAGVELTQAKIKQKTITAPFNGKIGIRLVNLGDYVSPGTAMVSLESLDPMLVRFSLPEQYLTDVFLQQPIDVITNSGKIFHGVIDAINSKVDPSTRNIMVQGTLDNKELKLYPGMFASIKIWFMAKNNVVVLPQTAIAYSLHGDSVFIIKKEGKLLKAYREYVKVGERRDNEVCILAGVKPNEQVVTAGQLKLQNGTTVEIDNNVEL